MDQMISLLDTNATFDIEEHPNGSTPKSLNSQAKCFIIEMDTIMRGSALKMESEIDER